MKKKKVFSTLCGVLCGVMGLSFAATSFVGCSKKKSSIVLMTEELSGLFNPFYSTSASDGEVVGMTQISMLSTDKEGHLVAGDEYPTVVKAFDGGVYDEVKDQTVYTFVLKNGLKFSDGKPLTMNDVMFNIYEYLDPVYTGSSTMYSVDIEGLSAYRTQKNLSGGSDAAMEQMNSTASAYAALRILELQRLFEDKGLIEGSTSSYSMTEEQMKAAIEEHEVSGGYKMAVSSTTEMATWTQDDYRKILLADYELTLKTFKEELESDYKAAKESFDLTTEPYAEHAKKLKNDVFKFLVYEGYITPKYATNQGKIDRTKIESFEGESIINSVKTKEEAINKVYNDNVKGALNQILTAWGTAGTLTTNYTAAALDVILHNNTTGDGLLIPNISGIVSLGHTTTETSVSVGGKTYSVANAHNEDGTPTDPSKHDVLQITVNKKDPKAIYNFGFTVAPAHYYSADEAHPNGREIDIAENKFGVEWADSEFQSKTIQSQQHLEIPVGAGPFKATNADNKNNPKGSEFWSSNVVYYKKNEHFMFDVKADKLRLQVVNSANALDKLAKGEVDYVTPQFTKANSDRLKKLEKKGFEQLESWQLGYGYIGINAGKVPNENIRKAIMSAMETKLALEYYETGMCMNIDWPMSMESWAYPFEDKESKKSKPNGRDYTQWVDEADARAKIQRYMNLAGVSAGDSALNIKFTIAGASITEHPTYPVFRRAADILNDMGWNVEVKADSQALTKLSTGSLEVWAAAWGSTLDPDMYQVYHKNSSATSVYAWGYREIKAGSSSNDFKYEYGIINTLSEVIDEARSYMDEATRTPLYEEAMGYVLDLAVELPVYQRKTLYAYNGKTIKGLSDDVNPYTSPLEKIWELELAK